MGGEECVSSLSVIAPAPLSILIGPPEAIPFLHHFKHAPSLSPPPPSFQISELPSPPSPQAPHPIQTPDTQSPPSQPPEKMVATRPLTYADAARLPAQPIAFHRRSLPQKVAPMGLTQNGAVTYTSSGNPCLDFFFHVKHRCEAHEVRFHLEKAWAEDPQLTMKLIFHVLAVRGTGKMDRESFYVAATWLHENHPRTLIANLALVPTLGCFKDLLEIVLMAVEGRNEAEARREARKQHKANKRMLQKRWERYGQKGLWQNQRGMPLRARRENKTLRQMYFRAARRQQLRKLKKIVKVAAGEKKRSEKGREVPRKRKSAILAARALAKYRQCERFRTLHDAVGDIFAEALRKDLAAAEVYKSRMCESEGSTSCEPEGEGSTLSESAQKRWGGRSGPRLSLAAKWAPSLKGSYDRTTLLAESIARRMFPRGGKGEGVGEDVSETLFAFRVRERYRKEVLVPLREALELPEVYMAAHRWRELPYGRVPSVCMTINKKRFEVKDGARFSEYLDDVKEGKAKIASGALLPHEILEAAVKDEEGSGAQVAELQWRSMVEEMRRAGALANGIAVCDVSGSMAGLPMEVGVALSLLVAELSAAPWNSHMITFSETPQIHRVEGTTLAERASFTKRMDWGMNTDFQAVFDGILARAKECSLAPQDMVRRLYVFSDMEFDQARGRRANSWATDHEEIVRKFEEAGYEVPEIVYWNLSQWESNSTPVTAEEPGAALVSGFSKNMLKVFMEGGDLREFNPLALMLRAMEGEEYSAVCVVD